MALGVTTSDYDHEIEDILCQLNEDAMLDGSSIKTHFFTKLKLALKVSYVYKHVNSDYLIAAIGRTVSPKWKEWVTNLLVTNRPRTLEEFFDLLLEHEKYMNMPMDSSDAGDLTEHVIETQFMGEKYKDITK